MGWKHCVLLPIHMYTFYIFIVFSMKKPDRKAICLASSAG